MSRPQPSKATVPDPFDKPQSKVSPIHSTHIPVKKLIQFVSLFPDIPNLLCFIFPNESSIPKKLFSLYPVTTNDFDSFGIYFFEITIGHEKTLMIGLDKSFVNLGNELENQSLTEKHLIFLYLLKKFQSIKFVLCFDKVAIEESSFLTVKNTINRLATIFDFQTRTNYGKAFMILISYHHKEDTADIEDGCKDKFKQAVEEKIFKLNNDFASQIVNNIFKSQKRSEQRCVTFLTAFPEENNKQKRESFEKVVKMTEPLKGNQIFNIKNQLYKILKAKSEDWKSIESDKTGNGKWNLQNLFSLWDQTFSKLMQFIGFKFTKGKQDFSDFTKSQCFLMDRVSEKFKIDELSGPKNQNKKPDIIQNRAGQVSNFLHLVMQFFQKYLAQRTQVQQSGSDEVKENFHLRETINFLKLIYKSKVLNPHNHEKIVFDFFMIMGELRSLWRTLKVDGPDNKTKLDFFSQNNLMYVSLASNPWTKFMFSNLIKSLNFILNIELNRIEKGQHVDLSSIEQPMKFIKAFMEEQLKIPSNQRIQVFDNESLRKTIAKFEKELCLQKITQLSTKPLQKIVFTLQNLKSQIQIIENRPLIDVLAKSCLDYMREYKNERTPPLNIKLKIIELLEFNMEANFTLIGQVYQEEIDILIQKARKTQKCFDEKEAEFIVQYGKFVIKLGMVQKLREKAHEISFYDKNLSKKMLCEALMRDCSKSHLEFILKSEPKLKRVPVSAEQEDLRSIEIATVFEAIDVLGSHFRKDLSTEKKKLKEEEELLDI